MTDQQLAGSSRTPRFGSRRKPIAATKQSLSWQMRKQLPSIALAACFVTLLSFGMPNAQGRQQCRAGMPSNPQGHWWPYRLIDGRKCWYEGKPMLSKSLLEWPTEASAQPTHASAQPNSDREPASVPPENPGNPLDSQAWAPDDSDTFEARWRAIGMTR